MTYFSQRLYFVIFGVFFVAIFIGLIVAVRTIATDSETRYENEIQEIKACMQTSTPLDCVRGPITTLLKKEKAARIIDTLSTELQGTGACHNVAHVVGVELYKKTHSTERALEECSKQCQQACVHGVLAETFFEQIGFDTGLDLGHMSSEEILAVGGRLCATKSSCHGVGHALYQIFGGIGPALDACTRVASTALADPCYRGVFMEFWDAGSNLGMRQTNSATSSSNDIDTPALDTLCDAWSATQRSACFWYFPAMLSRAFIEQGRTHEDARERSERICMAQNTWNDRSACVAGIGASESILIFTDPFAARQRCEQFDTSNDRVACIMGMVSRAAEYKQYALEVNNFCSGMVSEVTHSVCYQAFFHKIFEDEPVASASLFCKDDDSVCFSSASRYAEDSSEFLRESLFGK